MVFRQRRFFCDTPEIIVADGLADLETRVSACLSAVAGLDASDVSATAEDGTITLGGSVATGPEKHRAEEAARSVAGAVAVRNAITPADIRSPSTSS